MKKKYYIPFFEIFISNANWNNETNNFNYNYHIDEIGTIEVYYNFMNVLVTSDNKTPIFLDRELEDLIQDYFRTHPDKTDLNIPFGFTNHLNLTGNQLTKKR